MYKVIAGAVATSSASAVLVGTALAQAPTTPETYPYGPHMGWWGGMFFGPLFMLLVVVAVVVTVVLLVRRPGASWQGTVPPTGRTPLDILKERYARGEIDKADYDERRRVLGE